MITLRPDQALISEWIAPESHVLDLGCGDGALLKHLQNSRGVTGYGLEIDEDNVTHSVETGINVIQSDLDAGLSDFDDHAFDYVIMTQTLQAVHFPDHLLEEMVRVGREGIVTFPNFGHWRIRAQLLLGGRMPISRALPSQWYNTKNIHLCTLHDFEALCRERHTRILERKVVDNDHRTSLGNQLMPNLLGETALYRCQRG